MKSILIVSPDPQAGRMLELAFELHGWETANSSSLKGTRKGGSDAVLIDMVEGAADFKKGLTKASFKGSKVMAIAPRGEGEEALKREIPRIDMAVKRPYELMHLVRSVEGLMSSDQ